MNKREYCSHWQGDYSKPEKTYCDIDAWQYPRCATCDKFEREPGSDDNLSSLIKPQAY